MNNEVVGIFAGSYDPPTNGHYHMIKKACSIFDHVEVVLAAHPTKKPMFSTDNGILLSLFEKRARENMSAELKDLEKKIEKGE